MVYCGSAPGVSVLAPGQPRGTWGRGLPRSHSSASVPRLPLGPRNVTTTGGTTLASRGVLTTTPIPTETLTGKRWTGAASTVSTPHGACTVHTAWQAAVAASVPTHTRVRFTEATMWLPVPTRPRFLQAPFTVISPTAPTAAISTVAPASQSMATLQTLSGLPWSKFHQDQLLLKNFQCLMSVPGLALAVSLSK